MHITNRWFAPSNSPQIVGIIKRWKKENTKNKAQKTISENSSSNCIGSYTVQGYTRSDGTKVKEYIRTCGKHNKMSMEERAKGQAKYKGKRFQDIPADELEEAIGYFV